MLNIPDVLSPGDLAQIHDLIGEGRFVKGAWTAGGPAAKVKNNLLLDLEGDRIDQIAIQALLQSTVFQSYAKPLRFAPPMVNKYGKGMGYGDHIDGALMGRAPRMRCDLSITLFLSPPGEYEGGELIFQSHSDQTEVKLPAGAAVVYPSDTLHRVEAVRDGVRLVLVTWAQSMIRDEQIRTMLFDLERAIDQAEASGQSSEAVNLLIKTHANLYRKFAET